MVKFPQNMQLHYPTTVVENMEGLGSPVTRQDALEKEIVRRTMPEEYHLAEGNRLYNREETALTHARWREACQKNQAQSETPDYDSQILIIPTRGRSHRANAAGVKMADAYGIIRPKDFAVWVQKAYDAEKHLVDLLRSKLGEEVRSEHGEKLADAPDIEYIIVGAEPDDAILGVANICEHSAVYFVNKDAYKKLARWAEETDTDLDELINRANAEELLHLISDDDEPSIPEEKRIRESLIEKYTRLAERTKDPKETSKYQGIIKNLSKDLLTVDERYAKSYSAGLRELVAMYRNGNLEELGEVLKMKAIYEGGNNTEEGIVDYVTNELKAVVDAAEQDDADAPDSDTTDKDSSDTPNDQDNADTGDSPDSQEASDADAPDSE